MTLEAAASRTDITPPLGLPMAGYSTSGKSARRVLAPLQARVFVFASPQGGPVAVVVADLMSGTDALQRRLEALSQPLGFGEGRVMLVGTHTHTGPGNIYGWRLYDSLAQARPGLRPELVEHIAGRIRGAMAAAMSRLEPAQLAWGSTTLWGVAGNSAPAAFAQNPESGDWLERLQVRAPTDLPLRQRQVDPRLRCLCVRRPAGALIGVLGHFACHATALGEGADGYHPDWPGTAATLTEDALGGNAVVALLPGAGGDVNTTQPQRPQGPQLVEHVAQRVRQALLRAVQGAQADPNAALELRLWRAPRNHAQQEHRLAPSPRFGVASIGGAEDAPSGLHRLVARGWRRRATGAAPQDPQFPKRPVLGPAQGWIMQRLHLDTAPYVTLFNLRLGSCQWLTVPGEPTLTVGLRLERQVARPPGVTQCWVVGYAGDYLGYFTTPQEYALQRYEGASTLFGRHSALWLMGAHNVAMSLRADPLIARAPSAI